MQFFVTFLLFLQNSNMSLKQIAISQLAKLISRVRLIENVETTCQIAKYIHQLPINLIDDLFTHLVDTSDECLSSSEVAILLHPKKTKLIIDDLVNANGSCFDVQFMLNISGCNMTNLTELQLPVACSLPSFVCKQLCSCAVHLQTLNLYCVQICDDAMKFIANLHLQELNLNYTIISDYGANELCGENANIKTSLRIMRTYGSRMSARGHIPILESMPNLEDVDSNYSTLTLLSLLSSTYGQRISTLALRRLRTTPIRPNIVKLQDVQFAFKTCPKLKQVQLERLSEPREILKTLPRFDHLSRLELSLQDCNYTFEQFLPVLAIISDKLTDLKIQNFASKNEHFDAENLKSPLNFQILQNFSLIDHKLYPICNNLLIYLLSNCFNLKCLRLTCSSLTDEVIVQILSSNPFNGLNCLSLSNCPNMSLLGAIELLKIPSLTMVTLTDSLTREQQQQLFAQVDADKLNLFCADINLYF